MNCSTKLQTVVVRFDKLLTAHRLMLLLSLQCFFSFDSILSRTQFVLIQQICPFMVKKPGKILQQDIQMHCCPQKIPKPPKTAFLFQTAAAGGLVSWTELNLVRKRFIHLAINVLPCTKLFTCHCLCPL